LVNEAIQSASHNRTTIIVAHRLTTVRDADRIVVVESGRIVEMGTHDTLMTSDGLYAALFRHGRRETAD
jgi:ATP-binding cassette subfamily B protein